MAKKPADTQSSKDSEITQQAAGQMAVLPTTGQGEFLLYQTEDAKTRVQVRFEAGDVWLTQQQLADLYQSSPQNITQHIRAITQHIRAIYQAGELQEATTCKPYLQVRQERGRQVCWCKYASDYAKHVGGKPWKYILVPHDEIAESQRLVDFLRFEMKD